MANWKRFIEIEVSLPFITQGCTLGKWKTKIKITKEDIWFFFDVWRASVTIGDYKVGIFGKRSFRKTKRGFQSNASTYNVMAFRLLVGDTDIPNNNSEFFKTRVVSWS